MNIFRKAVILAIPMMFLVGCATAPTDSDNDQLGDDSVVDSGAVFTGDSSSSAETLGLATTSDISSQELSLDDPSSLLSKRVIYFDFDRSKIKDEFNEIIGAHAGYLAENPGAQIKLEGHADERGSREYNIGLGERRGNSVARYFGLQGAARGQLEVVSFGEERPVAMGNDDSAWSLNRRVEIIYTRER